MDVAVTKQKLVQLQREKLRRRYPKLWLAKYHHLTTHQKHMSFGNRYRFITKMYKDLEDAGQMCCMKSVQSGVTEMFTVSSLEEAARGLRILYVLPNNSLKGSYVKDRLDILLKIVPHYAKHYKESIGESESIGLKHYGKGTLNYVSSKSAAEFTFYAGDSLYVDEVDKCDQKNLATAPDRLDASDYKYDRRIGNPSIEGYGISALYNTSTQALWLVKCEHCGHLQNPDFFKHVVRQTGTSSYDVLSGTITEPNYVCEKCHKPTDRLADGVWDHRKPNALRFGYQANQLFSANVPLGTLVSSWFDALGKEIETQLFFNSKLGLPYSAEGSKITFPALEKALGDYTLVLNSTAVANKSARVYVGVDVGKYFHVIGREVLPNGQRRLVFVGRYRTKIDLIQALQSLKSAKRLMMDDGPELHLVEEIKNTVKRMYSCKFQLGQTLLDLRKAGSTYKKERRISIDRTFILDSVKDDFTTLKMINPINAKDLGNEKMEEYGEYYQNMLASTRTFDEDRGRFIWRETQPDHFFLAEAYCKMAENIDDRLLDFYASAGADGMQAYLTAEHQKAMVQPVIPLTEEGDIDTEKLKKMSAETFLNQLFKNRGGVR